MRVLIFVGDPADNQLGRAHSLWAIANESGHDVRIQSVVGGSVWAPLRDSHFAERCEVVSPAQLGATASNWADVMIVVKPRRESLGVALSAFDTRVVPLLVDVDDPDLESYLVYPSVARRLARHVRHPREVRRFRKLRKAAVSLPTITSNPVLQAVYGGHVIPHARTDHGAGAPHTSRQPRVAFIGTPRPHKGVDLLRAAVARLSTDGFTLVITASPPAEPTVAWEEWIGTTSDERGMELLGTCDIVALPSSAGGEGKAQLPMKLIDAMLAARAVAVSDLGPMRWALGDCGLLFDPDSVDSLVHALGRLRDPHLRQLLGEKARERALGMFTPALLAATLDAALSEAILATERRS